MNESPKMFILTTHNIVYTSQQSLNTKTIYFICVIFVFCFHILRGERIERIQDQSWFLGHYFCQFLKIELLHHSINLPFLGWYDLTSFSGNFKFSNQARKMGFEYIEWNSFRFSYLDRETLDLKRIFTEHIMKHKSIKLSIFVSWRVWTSVLSSSLS